jgi:hypothetical protein
MSDKKSGVNSPVLHLPVKDRLKASMGIVKRFVGANGIKAVRQQTVVDGFHIRHWLNMRRMDYHRGKLPDWLVKELESLPGWSWHPVEDNRKKNLALLKEYLQHYSWDDLTSKTIVEGVFLGAWVLSCRKSRAKGTIPSWLVEELEALPGWSWVTEDSKQVKLELLLEYLSENGWDKFHTRMIYKNKRIGTFVQSCRTRYHQGKMDLDEAKTLEAIPGWKWKDDRRVLLARRRAALLKQHILENGWDDVNGRLRIEGEPIGTWMIGCKVRQKKGKLSEWLTKELESIPGWKWNT